MFWRYLILVHTLRIAESDVTRSKDAANVAPGLTAIVTRSY